ncbi:right-handed parallel beta-helix repeat-containing protein, partial [Patescibacteria group bacterium]|nr:right-handed parallel beta-helix repeat-containing protein [Patescibacteria group bacterium]
SLIRIDFGTQQTITTAMTDTNGTFSVTFLVSTQPYGSTIIIIYSDFCILTSVFCISPQITQISPQSGVIGDPISISGNGFSGNEIVYFYVTGSTFGCLADQNGAFSSQFIINTQPGGTRVVTAQSVSGAMATSIFVILPQITQITPISGSAGTVVTLQGSGFGDQGSVRIDFGNTQTITSTTSSDSGTFSATFTVDNQTPGTKIITVSSDSSLLTFNFELLTSIGSVTVCNSYGTITGIYTTIQAGVNACPVGGTVSASAGTYPEAVYVSKGIALVGVGTPTIDASELGETNTVTFDGIATNNASISWFIITGSSNGIYCNNGSPTITNNTISGNSSHGIYCYSSSSPAITNNTISGNSSHGIYCYSSSSPAITNNTISGNGNTGIFCLSSSPLITNNTISGNTRHGIYCESSSPSITNNIITENGTTSESYYGIYDVPETPIIDYNCVWWNGSTGYNNYSGCIQGLNDISFNPQFIGGGDYHLQSSSPCIDAGSNTAPAIPSTDKDGNPRIIRIVDMGAYEFLGSFLQIRLLSPTQGPVNEITTIQGNTSATQTLITIDFGATQTITTTQSSQNGTFSATFTVDTQTPGTKTITARTDGISATTTFYLQALPPFICLTKTSTQTSMQDGGTITYTIFYENTGLGTATNATIYDAIPAWTEFATVTQGAGSATYSHDGGATYDASPNPNLPVTTIKWTIGDVASNENGTVKFEVRIKH